MLPAPGFEVSGSTVGLQKAFWLINDMSPTGLSSLWLALLRSLWLTLSSSHRLLEAHEQKDANAGCSKLTNSYWLMHVGFLRKEKEDSERNCAGSVFQKVAM